MSYSTIISITSSDRVGIVADISGAIKSLNGNLEDLSQTVMKGYFSMILLATFPDGTDEQKLRQSLHAVKGLSSFEIGILPYDPPKTAQQSQANETYVLTASGPDKVGLVAAITEYLKLKNINIIDLATRNENNIYTMMLIVKLPQDLDVGKLINSMKIAMEEHHLTISMRHQAIFDKVNEI